MLFPSLNGQGSSSSLIDLDNQSCTAVQRMPGQYQVGRDSYQVAAFISLYHRYYTVVAAAAVCAVHVTASFTILIVYAQHLKTSSKDAPSTSRVQCLDRYALRCICVIPVDTNVFSSSGALWRVDFGPLSRLHRSAPHGFAPKVGFTSIRVLCTYMGVPDAPDAFPTLYGSSVHDLALSTGLLKSFTAPCVPDRHPPQHSGGPLSTAMEYDAASVAEQRANAVARLRRVVSLPRMKDSRRPPMHVEAVTGDSEKFQADELQPEPPFLGRGHNHRLK
ncbi:hypothetical protein SCLCIDRAFT_34314 [Scleroderma citrinum Foug A]|uniref:Transmembrane protein n=1 Tax=Scleroderma citrinum Foug A TaxID=1036808 RepID=A0A0C2ZBJ5_9AGAM|nr:hypothetical protein SCLCIDRAFT_34314 [Scleroderma citrinum Foug A]